MKSLGSSSLLMALFGLAGLAAPARAEVASHAATPVRTAALTPPSSTAASAPSAPVTLERAFVAPERSYRRFGVMADAGAPDGVTASLVLRPIRMVRLHVGGSYNMISAGIRGGVTLVPLSWWASPTLSLDAGHYTDGDANPIARKVSGDPTFSSPMLERVGYDYVNAHLGLELGRKWFTFYLHAGMSRVSGQIHNVEAAFDGEDVQVKGDPDVSLWVPSARLGLIFYVAK
jgi:hypothetical protein